MILRSELTPHPFENEDMQWNQDLYL
jgi:hypothetical protein